MSKSTSKTQHWRPDKLGFFVLRQVDGIIVKASPYFAQLLAARNEAELIGRNISDFLPESSPLLRQLKAELKIKEIVEGMPAFFRKLNGSVFRVSIGARRKSHSQFIEAVISDQSQLEALENSLKLWELKFKCAQDVTKYAFLMIKKDRIIEASENFFLMTDYTHQEIQRGEIIIYDLIEERSQSAFREKISALNTGNRFSGKFSFTLKSKLGVEIETEAAFALLPGDKEKEIIGVIADNSRIALLESKLYQSQKMEAVGKLASGVAHDFNNLLTAIIGHSDLAMVNIKQGKSPKNDLEIIQSAADKASMLTRQLLAFSRKQRVEPKILNPNSLIQNMNKMLRRIIGEDIELIARLGEDVKRIKVDPGQLEQVIVNLAVNARDAMPSGGRLLIETRNVILTQPLKSHKAVVDPGSYIGIMVDDTGCGMSEEVRNKAFDPFFTTKPEGKGTGLGLSTVKEIVDQNGGKICIESELGRGSSFRVYFPMVSQDAEEYIFAEMHQDLQVGNETVLVVEDDDSVREFAVRLLKKLGYIVVEAKDGKGAIEAFKNREFDFRLILTDLIMPDMNGVELVKKLGEMRENCKIVYMSGYRPNGFIKEILEEGIPYLQKPFNPLDLANKVREALEG